MYFLLARIRRTTLENHCHSSKQMMAYDQIAFFMKCFFSYLLFDFLGREEALKNNKIDRKRKII